MTTPQAGYSKRSRLDKLGVKPDARVGLVGLMDAQFRRELGERTKRVSVGRPGKGTDMVLFAVSKTSELRRLTALRTAIAPNGAIWVLWPKGRPALREDDVRKAALSQGLVDIKVMAFSEALSGLKLVIPVAQR